MGRTLLYCQIEAQNPEHWAFSNWRAYFRDAGWTVLDFDYEVEMLRLGPDGMRELLRTIVRLEQPDLIWHSLYQEEFPPELVAWMRQVAPVIGFASDDSWRVAHSLVSAPAYTRMLTTERDVLSAYAAVGASAVWCPWAVHVPSYQPYPDPERMLCDLIFIGQCLPCRVEIVEQLWAAGVDLRVYGWGWKARFPDHEKVGGIPTFDEMKRLIAASRLVLGLCWGQDGVPQVKARHVEIPALGKVHLCNRDERVWHGYMPRELSPMWESVEQCVAQVGLLLCSEDRETIAIEGQKWVHQKHTWERRLTPIVEELLVEIL